jgi:hypothetical protein
MSESTSNPSSESMLRHVAPRLALLALGLAAFLLLGERWLTARALARAAARVEALELRVGGPDFTDAPGRDAGPWIVEVAAAKASGATLLPLASVLVAEGLRHSWAKRLATWDPLRGWPDSEVFAVFAVARELWTAADAELAAGRPRSAAEHLRALARVAVVLQDGTLPEARAGYVVCQELEARLAPLTAVISPLDDADALADLAAALTDVRPVEGLIGAVRREGAFVLAILDAYSADEPRAHLFGLVTGERTRASLATREHWADVGEALAEVRVGPRAAGLARLEADMQAAPRSLSSGTRDLPNLLREAARIQASFDAFRARAGAHE